MSLKTMLKLAPADTVELVGVLGVSMRERSPEMLELSME